MLIGWDYVEGLISKMRDTHKSTPPSFRRRENAAAIVKAPPPGALTKGPDRKFPRLHPPLGGATSPSLPTNRRFAFPILALLAVLAVGLLFMLPGGLLQAQDDGTIEYAENGTDPVATYTGLDPEGRPVYWSLVPAEGAADLNNDGDITDPGESSGDNPSADAGDFSISANGVLSFKLPPDFEMPKGAAPNVAADAPKLAAQNVYKIVVVASDDAPGAALDSENNDLDLREKGYHKVTVTVTDVDEDGSISFSAQQPQVGVALTATLTEQDATDAQNTAAKWKWDHAPTADGPWTGITVASANAETPGAGVVGKYLRATATYTDAYGEGKSATAVSAHAVRAKPAGENSSPVFPDEDGSTDGVPVNRTIDENSPLGTNVGKPVAAGDAGDILTYTLTGNGDDSKYRIDRATGQITVGPGTMLDREEATDSLTNFQHTVTVTATDPWGIAPDGDTTPQSATEQTVTITIGDLNEAPSITAGVTRSREAENDDSNPDEGIQPPIISTYTASDNDASDNDATGTTLVWSVSGPDAGDFTITGGITGGVLRFKTNPNYEKPADADMNNAYMVTVVATDAGTSTERVIGVDKLTATRDVVITVRNAQEEGKIKFSSNQPNEGVEFIATLTDDDGPTTVTKWQWQRDGAGTQGSPTDCSGDLADAGWVNAEGEGAKTDTYTPEADDLAQCLRVTPTYTDPFGVSMVMNNVSANPVVEDQENKAPQFKDANNKVITADTRSIAEDAVADDTLTPVVGNPVAAIDPNVTSDILTYTLGGTDARYFEITDANSSSGQITVKEGTKLDYEKKKSYMVTVTATDPSRASTTIDVTINVTDVNEGPEFTAPKEGDVDVTVKENTRSLNIYSFRATDPERRTVYWSLDASAELESSFTISDRGVLSLNTSPNYEDDGLGADKTYTVVVVASDDATGAGIDAEDPIMPSTKTVTVTVEDVEEPGAITTSPKNPHVGEPVTATLTDADGELGTITWEWKAGTAVVGSGSESSYSPVAGDVHKTLSVKVSYTQDGDGVTITKSAGTVRGAPSPANEPPTFADTAENNARSVDEDARVGTTLGKAIKAIDPNGDSLTYSLTGENASSFRISSSSGQLSTAAVLNHEASQTLAVTITATDPWGAPRTIDVTVTVGDVNEAPMITTGPTRRDREENAADDALQVFTYVASDVDAADNAADLNWSIEGEDAAKFDIGEDTGLLTFKESPDYEMPADRNKDNVYKVTVVVSDDGSPKLTDKRQVEVTVTDMEENGEVTLSSVLPKVAIQQTATLEDSDGDVKDTAWQWYRSDTCPDALTEEDQALITALAAGSDWSKIPDAGSDTYTPEAGTDKDEGKCLLALAKYNDRRGTSKAAAKQSDNVVIVNTDNRAPMFPKTEMGVREVMENAHPANVVLDALAEAPLVDDVDPNLVMATDPNGDTLTYTLGGTDAASFNINAEDGQIMT